jgi:hypothetical protein
VGEAEDEAPLWQVRVRKGCTWAEGAERAEEHRWIAFGGKMGRKSMFRIDELADLELRSSERYCSPTDLVAEPLEVVEGCV